MAEGGAVSQQIIALPGAIPRLAAIAGAGYRTRRRDAREEGREQAWCEATLSVRRARGFGARSRCVSVPVRPPGYHGRENARGEVPRAAFSPPFLPNGRRSRSDPRTVAATTKSCTARLTALARLI